MKRFKKGDPVWYRGFFGSGPRQKAVVDDIGEKNGEVVYDVEVEGSTIPRWGYERQLEPRRGDA